jgi:hypothetical protein
MINAEKKKIRQMPKGGRKGGSVFPRVAFNDALSYARKLVSKTHTSAQSKDVILSGVVGAKGGKGAVRMSALKQYGFLKGDTKSNFSADELAKQIVMAPHDELIQLYRQAMLKPAVFKRLFDTFHGDAVTKAKLKQRAADLKVHPDEAETCVELYVSGMTTAGLVTVEGDRVTHMASSEVSTKPAGPALLEANLNSSEEASADGVPENENDIEDDTNPETEAADGSGASMNVMPLMRSLDAPQPSQRAVFNVNVTLDSSLDIEKLQRQLELLKRFGAI